MATTTIESVLTMGRQELARHGLADQGWVFELDSGKTRAGCCKHHKRIVSISRHLVTSDLWTPDMIRNTLLHEVAHALAGSVHGHDETWRQIAVSIGCDGKRCHSTPFTKTSWTVTCPCGSVNLRRHTLRKSFMEKRVCVKCRQNLIATKDP
jgi:predicted SprT family Zn-dependent metalloprotease